MLLTWYPVNWLKSNKHFALLSISYEFVMKYIFTTYIMVTFIDIYEILISSFVCYAVVVLYICQIQLFMQNVLASDVKLSFTHLLITCLWVHLYLVNFMATAAQYGLLSVFLCQLSSWYPSLEHNTWVISCISVNIL